MEASHHHILGLEIQHAVRSQLGGTQVGVRQLGAFGAPLLPNSCRITASSSAARLTGRGRPARSVRPVIEHVVVESDSQIRRSGERSRQCRRRTARR